MVGLSPEWNAPAGSTRQLPRELREFGQEHKELGGDHPLTKRIEVPTVRSRKLGGETFGRAIRPRSGAIGFDCGKVKHRIHVAIPSPE